MAKWRKKESLGHALAREGRSVVKGVGRELLSIATLGFYRRSKYSPKDNRRGRR